MCILNKLREITSPRRTSQGHNNKGLNRRCYLAHGTGVNTRYIHSTQGTPSRWTTCIKPDSVVCSFDQSPINCQWQSQECVHTPSIAFRHLPPNSARFSYVTEGALFISAQLSSDAVSALRKVWILIRHHVNMRRIHPE